MTPTYVHDYSKGDYEGSCQYFTNSDLTVFTIVWMLIKSGLLLGT